MSDKNTPVKDPLGLEHLGRIIEMAADDPNGLARIASVYQAVMSSYTALQDRYRLLKESNRLLAEEVAWLRDQCDDFAVERSELCDGPASSERPKKKSGRRLEDRR